MYLVGDFAPQDANPTFPDVGDELVLANLEGPICSNEAPDKIKVGVHIRNKPMVLPGRWAFALANNHVMDYGEEGLFATRRFLNESRFPYAGAGASEQEAREPMRIVEGGKQIIVFSCCEQQFGVAESYPSKAGVAAKGEWLLDAVAREKRDGADCVIVSCHCGCEFSSFASPILQGFYHRLLDAGADVVHGHHSHVPQGWESYKGKPIFYGLGNFIVDKKAWSANPHYKWSLMAHLDFSNDRMSWSIVPIGDVPVGVEDYLNAINLGFRDSRLMKPLWQESCVQSYYGIYRRYLRIVDGRLSGLRFRDRARMACWALKDIWNACLKRKTPPKWGIRHEKILYHYFNCESHRDAIATALGVLNGITADLRTEESRTVLRRTQA